MGNLADTRPLCAIYVAWHPELPDGDKLAKQIYDHFRRDLFSNVAGGVGLSVLYRSASASDNGTPLDIPLGDAHVSVIFLLLSSHIERDDGWTAYVRDLLDATSGQGLTSRLIAIAIDGASLRVLGSIQALRYDEWADTDDARQVRLISTLTHDLCRLLRTYLAHIEHPGVPVDELSVYLEKARVFLSHSKHDDHGEVITRAIRRYLFNDTALASFFDVDDIPAGLSFADVLVHYVRSSAVVAIYTNSYSSREWCRREIIEAKRANVPLIVADCITDVDERGFPYMGNVPLVRMEPKAIERIPYVVARLLDEVFKDYLWNARVTGNRARPDVVFLPRPPELIALASTAVAVNLNATVVYPDPPLGSEESDLFSAVRPGLILRSFTDWAAQYGGSP